MEEMICRVFYVYLLWSREESSIGSLEFAVSWLEIICHTLVHLSLLSLKVASLLTEPEWVNSIWASEELSFTRISLNIFPACVGPSAWHEFEIVGKFTLLILTIMDDVVLVGGRCVWSHWFLSFGRPTETLVIFSLGLHKVFRNKL